MTRDHLTPKITIHGRMASLESNLVRYTLRLCTSYGLRVSKEIKRDKSHIHIQRSINHCHVKWQVVLSFIELIELKRLSRARVRSKGESVCSLLRLSHTDHSSVLRCVELQMDPEPGWRPNSGSVCAEPVRGRVEGAMRVSEELWRAYLAIDPRL